MPISLLRNMLRVLRSSPNLPNSELRSALLKRPSRSAAELRAAACSHKPGNLKFVAKLACYCITCVAFAWLVRVLAQANLWKH